DSALIGIIASLISHLDSGKIFQSVQNDIYNTDLRLYRIGVTREYSHNTEHGRTKLFKDYEKCVIGSSSNRRSGASIYLEDMRHWMEDFSNLVITYLESKKS